MQGDEMKHVFVVFSKTDTGMGRLIRFFTRNQYNHVSLTLEDELSRMYSFARHHYNSPLFGGFVVETPMRYLFQCEDIEVKVCAIPVAHTEYEEIKKTIEWFLENKNKQLYNSFSAVCSLLGKRMAIEDAYNCVEFVSHILGAQDVVSIKALERELEPYVFYTGSYKEIVSFLTLELDDFVQRESTWQIVSKTARQFAALFTRAVFQ